MYKSEFSKLCQDSKVSNVILDYIGNGFKMCFENGTNVNISIGEDWDENSDGEKVFWKTIEYKTDEEIKIEEENSIPIFDKDGKITQEYKDYTDQQMSKLIQKYSDDNFGKVMARLQKPVNP